jgi:hypothetical protein
MAPRATGRARHVTGARSAGPAPVEARGPGLSYDDGPPKWDGRRKPDPPPPAPSFVGSHEPIAPPPVGRVPKDVNPSMPYPGKYDLMRDLAFLCGHQALNLRTGTAQRRVAKLPEAERDAVHACLARLTALDNMLKTGRGIGFGSWVIYLNGRVMHAARVAAAVSGREHPAIPLDKWIPTLPESAVEKYRKRLRKS